MGIAGRLKSIFCPKLLSVVCAICLVLLFSGCSNMPQNTASSADATSLANEVQNESEDDDSDNVGEKEPRQLKDYSWDEIAAISSEIAASANETEAIEIAKSYGLVSATGTLDGTQTKQIVLTNGNTTSAQIAGFLHDDKTEGGKAGITFILTDAIGEHEMSVPEFDYERGTNAGGWEKSSLRSWMASEGLNLFPAELRKLIVPVDKFTNNVGGNAESVEAVSATSDALWLYSKVELGGVEWNPSWDNASASTAKDIAEIFNMEGSQYKLFRDADVSHNSWVNKILERYGVGLNGKDGKDIQWWLRSSDISSSISFLTVDQAGQIGKDSFSANMLGVIPGFCI